MNSTKERLVFPIRTVNVPHMLPEGAVMSSPKEVYGSALTEVSNRQEWERFKSRLADQISGFSSRSPKEESDALCQSLEASLSAILPEADVKVTATEEQVSKGLVTVTVNYKSEEP